MRSLEKNLFVSTAAIVLLGYISSLHAQSLRAIDQIPGECDSLITLKSDSTLVDWRETVELEHCDRIRRLLGISQLDSIGAAPLFFDGSIAADSLPSAVGVRLPLLRVVFPNRVFFDTAETTLRKEALAVVEIVAKSLQQEPPDVALFIAGHADARGPDEYNLDLSIRRANAVAEAILDYGVNLASIWRVGFGEDMPISAGNTASAYGENRRVEFLFAAAPAAVAAWLADAQLEVICQGRAIDEMQQCKQSLNLRSDYYAVELSRGVNPVETLSRERQSAVAGGEVARVSASQVTPDVSIATSEKVKLEPRSTRKIRINPVNRKASPVESDSLER